MAKTRKVTKEGTSESADTTRKPTPRKTSKKAVKNSGGYTVILNRAQSYTIGKLHFRKGIPKKVKDMNILMKLKRKGGMFTIRGL